MEIVDLGSDVSELNEQDKQSLAVEQALSILQERIAELEFFKEDKGWDRLGGDFKYELSKSHLNSVVARARLYFLHNPLINRAVTLQSDYVFAQGLNIQATNKDVNQVIQYFLDDKQNQREISGHQARLMKEQTLMLDGNVFLVLFTDTQGTGKVQVRSILVDEITNIITNPDDQNEIWYYKREWSAIDETGKTEFHTSYYPDIDYLPINRPTTTKDGNPIMWNAPIYHIKVGSLSKSRYGVPEVYAALDWAQAHRKFLEDWVTIVRSYARFAWRMEVQGNRNAVTAAKTKLNTSITNNDSVERNPAPLVGSTFISTKGGNTLEPVKTSGATTSAQDGREIRMMVAAALGIPDTFFGDVDVGNLATARTLDRPTELKYRSRQTLWEGVYEIILNHVIKWAIIAPKGPLAKKVKPVIDFYGNMNLSAPDEMTGEKFDTHIEIAFPPILEHSIADRITAVANAVTLNGKSFAVDSPELAKLTIRLMLQALGISNVDELTKTIFNDMDKIKNERPEDNGIDSSSDSTDAEPETEGSRISNS